MGKTLVMADATAFHSNFIIARADMKPPQSRHTPRSCVAAIRTTSFPYRLDVCGSKYLTKIRSTTCFLFLSVFAFLNNGSFLNFRFATAILFLFLIDLHLHFRVTFETKLFSRFSVFTKLRLTRSFELIRLKEVPSPKNKEEASKLGPVCPSFCLHYYPSKDPVRVRRFSRVGLGCTAVIRERSGRNRKVNTCRKKTKAMRPTEPGEVSSSPTQLVFFFGR